MTDEDLVRELCDIETGLTDWEVEFVESVAKQVLDQNRPLSDRQRKVAHNVKDRRGGGRQDPDEELD